MDIRPSPIAGTWYSSNPDALADQLDGFLLAARPPKPSGELIGVIVPHAGHRYSGAVAAQAFRLMRGLTPEIVAVVSPMHTPAPDRLVTSGHDAYQTPLGIIPVDADAVRALHAALETRSGLRLFPLRNDREHSLEIELPFLQRVLGEFRLLPVMILDPQESTAHALGSALAETLAGRRVLLVASSDLSHFYPDPAARKLDAEMMRRIAAFDPSAVIRAEEEEAAFACGRAAVAAVLWAAKGLGADLVTPVAYGNSGDVTGDRSSVVGYGAAAIWRHASP
ncbi:MAG: AmmeMemoRadiSam system protein B [Anaerolineales bacterium]|nr:AmmeMemoRadiSam system protein B [Anaerolineales bacterium]